MDDVKISHQVDLFYRLKYNDASSSCFRKRYAYSYTEL